MARLHLRPHRSQRNSSQPSKQLTRLP